MKRPLLAEGLRWLQANPNRKKLLRKFAVVSFIFLLSVGAMAVWAGVTAVGYVSEIAQRPKTQETVGELRTMVSDGAKSVTLGNCWKTASDLLQVQPWVEKSVVHHLRSLKVACLEGGNIHPESEGGNKV